MNNNIKNKGKKSKMLLDEEYINTEEINKIIHRSHDFRNKSSEELFDFSSLQYVSPTWLYFSIKDENELKRMSDEELKEIYEFKNNFFQNKNKNTDVLFSKLGENISLILSLYSDQEIFELYINKDFRVEVNECILIRNQRWPI